MPRATDAARGREGSELGEWALKTLANGLNRCGREELAKVCLQAIVVGDPLDLDASILAP